MPEFINYDLLGYIAGAFLLMMASMKTQLAMRLCNMAGNLCFIAYGFLAGVMPVFILNIIILGLHFWRIMQERRKAGDGSEEQTGDEAAAGQMPVARHQPPFQVLYKGNIYQRVEAAGQ